MNRLIPICICTLLALSGCSQPEQNQQPAMKKINSGLTPITLTPEQKRRTGLVVETAVVTNLAQSIEVAATVQPDETLTMPVSSLVPGRAEQVFVRLGDSVSQGQILATIRSADVGSIQTDFLQSLLEQRADAKQKLLELHAEAKQLETKVEFLEKQYQRKKFLVENKIGSKAELEATQSELLQAQSALEAAQAKEKSAREAAAAKERALFITSKEKLKLHGLPESEIDRVAKHNTVKSIFEIRAPKAGLITSRDIDPGETTDANRHLFVITDLARIWMVGQIFEKDVSSLSLKMPVVCTVDSYPSRQFKGHLDYLGSKLDPQTRTLPIRASVVNSDYKLRPDMFGQISIGVGTIHALAVSRKALQKIGETQIVYVQSGADTFTERKVVPGLIVGEQVQILSGLAPGERVVTKGSIHLLGTSLQQLKQ